MSVVDESVNLKATPMQAVLDAGIDQVSGFQSITFTLFKKYVSQLDGFVYWCQADILSPNALGDTSRFNEFQFNQPRLIVVPAQQFDAQGSLHHTTLNQQDESESFSLQKMVFTSQVPVDRLTAVAPDELWVAEFGGLRFAFSSRSMFYVNAGIYHYAGDALYPSLNTQVVDSVADLRLDELVVSNSLPIWLTLNGLFPVYNSYLVPDNVSPPYAAIQIGVGDTSSYQNWPIKDATGTRWELTKDRVKVVTYGVRNNLMLDFIEMVGEYTLSNPSVMGLVNTPVNQDDKRGQTEFSILGQKKVTLFEVSYYQTRALDLARQLILSAFIEDFIAVEYSEQQRVF